MSLTAVLLSHNNEESIRRCIKSLNFCDEVVVIDDDSEDKTREIASSLGAKVYKRSLNSDFAAQRNSGLAKAGGDWIIFIDSDEEVSENLAKEIRDRINDKYNSDVNGYFLKRDDTVYGMKLKFGETASVRILRLGKKDKGRWERPVHEVWKISGNTGMLSEPLIHHSHHNVTDFLDSINGYSTLNAEYFFKNEVRSSLFIIITYPAGKFIVNYFLKLGFFDGVPGFIMAMMMSFHSFLTRAKLYLLWKKCSPKS